MDEHLAYFLELRIRLRGRAEAVAIVDRCIGMIARADGASPAEVEVIELEFEALRRDLILRFGERKPITQH
ncbi:hypothetical protein [Phenylobacterium kunshanense]|uniref:Uncharacterized protein n=1 Tax=Phenylobacterium kunshanense TaxID=1445034 RepID=A0A328BHF1_9CAUL|nr:hypothetical protein [Phenylobacterium kunshanense]RAK66377.1 hypothetical protein DJ019_09020 [Phenylobacterium kunshanense]